MRKYDVPPPAPDFIDHVLGGALLRNYLLDLRQPAPETVRRWLRRRGSMRIYGGAYYDPTLDSHYFHALDRWGMGFDALLHLREVSAARPL